MRREDYPVVKRRRTDGEDNSFVRSLSMAERMAMVWPITQSVWAFISKGDVPSDFHDILSEFNAARVEYLIVGAYAVAAHGIPRATGVIDLWVRPSAENAARVIAALAAFGAPMTTVQASDFTQPDLILQLGVPPLRIDIMTSIDAITFEAAWPRRIQIETAGLTIPVIGRADLLLNKRSTGRARDAHDALALEEEEP